MVPCSRFTWITNFSDHRRMQEVHNSNPPVATGICHPSKSRAQHHRSLKLDSKLKYLKIN